MSLRDLNRKQLWLIGMRSGRTAIRGGTGVVFVYLVLLCGLWIANVVLMPVEGLRTNARERAGVEIEERRAVDDVMSFGRPAIEWALGRDAPPPDHPEHERVTQDVREWTEYLLNDRPGLLSAVFVLMLFLVPLLVAAGTFNQTSGDVGSRGIRFLLLRTERANLFFGRYLGAVIFTVVCLALLLTMVVLYMGFKLDLYAWGDLLGWGVRGWLALSITAVPYVAVCAAVSASFDSPFGSLLICYAVTVAVPLFAMVGKLSWYPLTAINWLLPWGVQFDLLHPEANRWLPAIVCCGLYALAFLALGYWRFSRRDL